MSRVILPTKLAGETLTLEFDFSSSMDAADSITSASSTCTLYSGTDPSPSAVINGGTVITGDQTVTQSVIAGVVGVTYLIVVTANTLLGQILQQSGFLLVVPDQQ